MIRKTLKRLISACLLAGCALPGHVNDADAIPVHFRFETVAQSVCVGGDFNHWAPDLHCLRRQGRVWSIVIPIPRGTYRYAFIVDGQQWVADPSAVLLEMDGFGRCNAVLIVQ